MEGTVEAIHQPRELDVGVLESSTWVTWHRREGIDRSKWEKWRAGSTRVARLKSTEAEPTRITSLRAVENPDGAARSQGHEQTWLRKY